MEQERLRRLMAGGRVSHAYRITGAEGEDFARTMAGALICEGTEKPCGRCAGCKKAALDIHPDIITLSPEEGKKEILVDQIRQMRTDAYIRPNEARKKVYILSPADAMNENAQNALLKVLEEGPAYAVFLLVCGQAGALLPTIRSRCEEIFLAAGKEKKEEWDPRAEQLGQLLLGNQEQKLMEFCVGLEKLNREEVTRLLEQTVFWLKEKAREDIHSAQTVIPFIEKLKTLQDAARFNTGVGHLTGWLCAAAFE